MRISIYICTPRDEEEKKSACGILRVGCVA